jgi:hypothetical protein
MAQPKGMNLMQASQTSNQSLKTKSPRHPAEAGAGAYWSLLAIRLRLTQQLKVQGRSHGPPVASAAVTGGLIASAPERHLHQGLLLRAVIRQV